MTLAARLMARLKELVRLSGKGTRHRRRPPLEGQFQPYNHTLPDRYPWLFTFATTHLLDSADLRLLSFGCSAGDEAFALRRYFPRATIRGIDVDAANIALCEARAQTSRAASMSFATAASTAAEPSASYDAIFCLAVLCHGDLTVTGAQRSDPLLRFRDFELIVADFERCLKPGGLLFLHTTNFRFVDTDSARNFDVVYEAELADLAPDVVFDRNNGLMPGERYQPVAFRKHLAAPERT
jgi:2-polyprenyl-3-methyl-5-hydroxy-6-metoxy-1,4-benzoquinol methylase